MVENNGELSRSGNKLFINAIEPVYRYHLSRSENYIEAQNLTIQTLAAAVEWSDNDRAEDDSLHIWIMKIACSQQSYGKRRSPPELITKKPVKPPEPDSTLISYTSSEDSLPLEQAEIVDRNRMAHLSSAWREMPTKQADALALHYFAGLSVGDTCAVLHQSEAAVRRLIARQAPFETELVDLAATLHPNRDFLAILSARLDQPIVHKKRTFTKWLKPVFTHPFSGMHRFFRWSKQLAQAGLVAGILVFGFYMIQRQSVIPPSADLTTTPSPTLMASIPTPTPLDNPGNLVPPATGVCQQWQTTLAKVVDQDLTRSYVSFTDPTQTGYRAGAVASGTGCLLQTTVSSWDLHSGWSTFDLVSEQLMVQNYNQIGDAGYPGYGDPLYFDPGCYGLGRTFETQGNRAILTVSWCPSPQPTSQFNPNISNNGPVYYQSFGGGNFVSAGLGPYVVKLVMATDDLSTRLNEFFVEWAAGSSETTDLLVPALYTRFPNLAALDRLAAVTRVPSRRISFDWQVKDNSGPYLRLTANAIFHDANGSFVTSSTQFQMAVVQESAGWAIKNLGTTVQFSSRFGSQVGP